MKKNLLLLLLALLALASCEQKGYQPKNQVEETLLGVARDSLGHRGEITIFDFTFIDTFTHYKKDYEDTLRTALPNSTDFFRAFDSLEARYAEAGRIIDSIANLYDTQGKRIHSNPQWDMALNDKRFALGDEQTAISKKTRSLTRILQRYKWMLASGQDPFVFIAGQCGYMHEDEYQGIYFVLSGDGKQVLMYRDVVKYLEKIQKDRDDYERKYR